MCIYCPGVYYNVQTNVTVSRAQFGYIHPNITVVVDWALKTNDLSMSSGISVLYYSS